jgi:transposase
MPQRKRYTKQFKEEALRLVSQEGVSLTQIAQDLGLDAGMLRRWRKDAETLGQKPSEATDMPMMKNSSN